MRICTRYPTYLEGMDVELSKITSDAELQGFLEKWTKPIEIIRQKIQAAPVLRLWINKEHIMTVKRVACDAKTKADEWQKVEALLA